MVFSGPEPLVRSCVSSEPQMKEGPLLSRLRRGFSQNFLTYLTPALLRAGLSPDQATVLGAVVAVAAGAVAGLGHLLIAGVLVLLAGLFDLMDGALARAIGKTTTRGAFLDSTMDRIAEIAVLAGLLAYAVGRGMSHEAMLVYLAMAGALTVSYVKARAEGLGLSCDVGLFTRPERVVVLAIGLLVGHLLLPLYIVTVLSFITAAHRFLHVWNQQKE